MKSQALYMIIILLFGYLVLPAQVENDISVPLSNPGERGKLIVDIKKGPITVKGTSRDDVLVRYSNRGSDEPRLEEASGGLKKISGGMAQLEILEKNNQIYIESGSWNKGLKLYVEVPQNTDLNLKTYHDGDTKVSDVDGELVIESFHGPITAENISGSLVANTYHGPIKASFRKVKPETPMAFTTFHGDVDLTLPAAAKASFKLKTERGDVYTGFDMELSAPEVKRKRDEEGSWSKTIVDGWITGTVNGGGPEFLMKNYHGDIFIRKQ